MGEELKKIKMGAKHLLNPKPVILVGTVVNNKPNFITVSWSANTSLNPPTMVIAIRDIRYSLKGIEENQTFSVNIPSADMVKETEFCGSFSGSEFDKVEKCNFSIFIGKLKNAPLIEQCPVNMECEVIQTVKLGDHSVIFGKIIESYISEDAFTNEIPDIKKINPLSFCSITNDSMGYYTLGEFVDKTGSILKDSAKE